MTHESSFLRKYEREMKDVRVISRDLQWARKNSSPFKEENAEWKLFSVQCCPNVLFEAFKVSPSGPPDKSSYKIKMVM